MTDALTKRIEEHLFKVQSADERLIDQPTLQLLCSYVKAAVGDKLRIDIQIAVVVEFILKHWGGEDVPGSGKAGLCTVLNTGNPQETAALLANIMKIRNRFVAIMNPAKMGGAKWLMHMSHDITDLKAGHFTVLAYKDHGNQSRFERLIGYFALAVKPATPDLTFEMWLEQRVRFHTAGASLGQDKRGVGTFETETQRFIQELARLQAPPSATLASLAANTPLQASQSDAPSVSIASTADPESSPSALSEASRTTSDKSTEDFDAMSSVATSNSHLPLLSTNSGGVAVSEVPQAQQDVIIVDPGKEKFFLSLRPDKPVEWGRDKSTLDGDYKEWLEKQQALKPAPVPPIRRSTRHAPAGSPFDERKEATESSSSSDEKEDLRVGLDGDQCLNHARVMPTRVAKVQGRLKKFNPASSQQPTPTVIEPLDSDSDSDADGSRPLARRAIAPRKPTDSSSTRKQSIKRVTRQFLEMVAIKTAGTLSRRVPLQTNMFDNTFVDSLSESQYKQLNLIMLREVKNILLKESVTNSFQFEMLHRNTELLMFLRDASGSRSHDGEAEKEILSGGKDVDADEEDEEAEEEISADGEDVEVVEDVSETQHRRRSCLTIRSVGTTRSPSPVKQRKNKRKPSSSPPPASPRSRRSKRQRKQVESTEISSPPDVESDASKQLKQRRRKRIVVSPSPPASRSSSPSLSAATLHPRQKRQKKETGAPLPNEGAVSLQENEGHNFEPSSPPLALQVPGKEDAVLPKPHSTDVEKMDDLPAEAATSATAATSASSSPSSTPLFPPQLQGPRNIDSTRPQPTVANDGMVLELSCSSNTPAPMAMSASGEQPAATIEKMLPEAASAAVAPVLPVAKKLSEWFQPIDGAHNHSKEICEYLPSADALRTFINDDSVHLLALVEACCLASDAKATACAMTQLQKAVLPPSKDCHSVLLRLLQLADEIVQHAWTTYAGRCYVVGIGCVLELLLKKFPDTAVGPALLLQEEVPGWFLHFSSALVTAQMEVPPAPKGENVNVMPPANVASRLLDLMQLIADAVPDLSRCILVPQCEHLLKELHATLSRATDAGLISRAWLLVLTLLSCNSERHRIDAQMWITFANEQLRIHCASLTKEKDSNLIKSNLTKVGASVSALLERMVRLAFHGQTRRKKLVEMPLEMVVLRILTDQPQDVSNDKVLNDIIELMPEPLDKLRAARLLEDRSLSDDPERYSLLILASNQQLLFNQPDQPVPEDVIERRRPRRSFKRLRPHVADQPDQSVTEDERPGMRRPPRSCTLQHLQHAA